MPNIKLLLADVDGTLVTKAKLLTPRAIAAIEALRAQNIAFAITSGRPPRGMKMLIAPLNLTTPIAGFNGGAWVNPDLTLIETHLLPRTTAEKTIAHLQSAGLDIWLYNGTDWFVRNAEAPHVAHEAATVQFQPKISANNAPLLDDIVKIVGVSDDSARINACATSLRAALGTTASAALSQPYYLDITHAKANKGCVAQELSQKLQIPPAQIATIGDSANDIAMFAQSGLSIAMGQATHEVKAAANLVTDSCEDEGFAKAIEKYILGEQK